jgi:hypothetical protein
MHPLARKSFESAARANLRVAIGAMGEDAASGPRRETRVREPDTRETA